MIYLGVFNACYSNKAMLVLIEDHRYQRSVIDITNWLTVSQTTMEFFFLFYADYFLMN